MGDALSHAYRAHREAVAVARRRFGHLSRADRALLHDYHRDQAAVIREQIRRLERQLGQHDTSADLLLDLLLEDR